MAIESINIAEKYSLFTETWSPRIIGDLNENYIKIARLKDDFVWHSHEHEDEFFVVYKGTLFMDRTFAKAKKVSKLS
jgi:mannose-6-phosphate isomerase-like protein (cupin superfamily)